MKFTANALSSVAIQVNWQSEPGDALQNTVTINEAGPHGPIASQTGLPFVAGTTFFGGLSPSTTYQYQMIGVAQTDSGQTETPFGMTSQTTKAAAVAPSGGGSGGGSGSGSGSSSGSDRTQTSGVVVSAKPFGRIVVNWIVSGPPSNIQLIRFILPAMNPEAVIALQPGTTGYVDVGPFVKSSMYLYTVQAVPNGWGAAYSMSVIYPASFNLKDFLPSGFDPSQGIKKLRPYDHPFVSVRNIMSG